MSGGWLVVVGIGRLLITNGHYCVKRSKLLALPARMAGVEGAFAGMPSGPLQMCKLAAPRHHLRGAQIVPCSCQLRAPWAGLSRSSDRAGDQECVKSAACCE